MLFSNDNKKKNLELTTKIIELQKLYRRVFDSEDGKLVLEDLKKRCFVDMTTFDQNVYRSFINEGRRSIYVHINNFANKDLEKILSEITKGE